MIIDSLWKVEIEKPQGRVAEGLLGVVKIGRLTRG
jgi:hypothetical protein